MAHHRPVPTRRLGRNGPLVPAIGYGCMNLSAPDSKRFRVLDRGLEFGATSWITSDVYDDSETLLDTWFTRTPSLRSPIPLCQETQLGAPQHPLLPIHP